MIRLLDQKRESLPPQLGREPAAPEPGLRLAVPFVRSLTGTVPPWGFLPRLGPLREAGAAPLRVDSRARSAAAPESDAYDKTLTRAEASRRIELLRAKLDKERHAGNDRPG